mgnify:CR=1 FL=1
MEQVLYRTQASWRSLLMIRRILMSVLADAALLGILYLLHTQSVLEDVWLVLIALGGIALTISSVRLLRSSAVYTITSGGVNVEEGFPIRTHSSTMSHSKIQVVDVRQTLLEKLVLKTGDVCLETAAESMSGDEIVLRSIANPQRVASMIRQGEAQGNMASWDHPASHAPSWDRPAQPSQPPHYPQQGYGQAPQQPPVQPPHQDPYGQPPAPWDR